MSTWIRRSSVVLLKPALAHSMTSFHQLIIPLNSSDTNSSSDIKSKMHLCENECEHGTFHLIWVFREHHIYYLLFAIFLDCGVDEKMYNSWAVSSLANLASDERCFAKFPFLLLQRNRLHLTRSKQYNGIVVKAKSTITTLSFFRPYLLYCFNSREFRDKWVGHRE